MEKITYIAKEEQVEHQIRTNIIPVTKQFGTIGIIITGIGMGFSAGFTAALIYVFASLASMCALLILLDGYAEIISLLRRIAEQVDSKIGKSAISTSGRESGDSVEGDCPKCGGVVRNLDGSNGVCRSCGLELAATPGSPPPKTAPK